MGRPSLILLIAVAAIGSWMFFSETPLDQIPWGETTTRPATVSAVGEGGPRIRIATFNLDQFDNQKASQGDVTSAIVHIVSRFDVIALQEISSTEHHLLPNLVDALNQSNRGSFDFVVGPRVGRGSQMEQLGYIYNRQSVELDRYAVYSVNDPDDLIHSEPLVACFRAKGVDPRAAFTFTLVNIHTLAEEAERENGLLRSIFTSVRDDGRLEDDVILLGDFHASSNQLRETAFLPMMTYIVGEREHSQTVHDNLILDAAATTEFTGRSGLFDFLRELNLNADFAARISRHQPVWAEFSIVEGGLPGRVAMAPRGGK